MIEVVFLFVLALIWITAATVQDLRTREIANWISFSLIIFAIVFRFFLCLFSNQGYGFFYQGLIGLGIFFVLANLLYYGKMFAGGDYRLMVALGAVLPFYDNFSSNLKVFVVFFVLFLISGAIYGLIMSVFLAFKNSKKFKKEFLVRLKKNKKIIYLVMFFGLILMALGFFETILFTLGIIVFLFPYFYTYAKAVDNGCMVKKIKTSQLTEGDWIFKAVKIGKKEIKPNWGGLGKKDIVAIRKSHKEVLILQGIAFAPSFLISFIILGFLYFTNKLEFLWYLFG